MLDPQVLDGVWQTKQIEWTGDRRQMLLGHVDVLHGGGDVAVSQQQLNHGQAHASFEQVRGEGMAQGVNAMAVLNVGSFLDPVVHASGTVHGDRPRVAEIREQPLTWPILSPVFSQLFEQCPRKECVAILAPFALINTN